MKKMKISQTKVGDKFRWTNGNKVIVINKSKDTTHFFAAQGLMIIVWTGSDKDVIVNVSQEIENEGATSIQF